MGNNKEPRAALATAPGAVASSSNAEATATEPESTVRTGPELRPRGQQEQAIVPPQSPPKRHDDGLSSILPARPPSRIQAAGEEGQVTAGAVAVNNTEEQQDSAAVQKDPRARARRMKKKQQEETEPLSSSSPVMSETEQVVAKDSLDKDSLHNKDYFANPADEMEKGSSSHMQNKGSDKRDKDLTDPENDGVNPPPESALGTMPIVTAAAGMAGAPEVEYGVHAGYGGPGYADHHDGLPSAIAVSEGEDEAFLPYAVEYDPDAKPPLVKNRRFRLYFAVGVCLLIDIIVAVVVIVLLKSNGPATLAPTMAPSLAPSSSEEGLFREQFAAAVGPEVYTEGSHQYIAAEWILTGDPKQLERDDPSLIQRYLLALFYISTTNNGERPWRSCNRPGDADDDTCQFLKLSLDPSGEEQFLPEPSYRWLSGAHECQWAGNLCDDVDFTRAIELFAQEITGTLPTELNAFPYLQSVALGYNDFTGTLPTDFAAMRHLLNIELHGNMLSGTVPEVYYTASALQNFNIGENMFSGSISTSIGELTNIKGFHIHANRLTGTLPTELGKMEYLSYSRMNENFFTGTIPTEFGAFTLLQELWLATNQLTGTIPTELALMKDMTDMRLPENKLTGTIPEALYGLSILWRMDLNDNELTGTLSTNVGNLRELQRLRVNHNKLTGTIPTELAALPIQLIWIHMNQFLGAVPSQLCGLRPWPLVLLNADCHPIGVPIGLAPNVCECCTACCDRNSELCFVMEGE